MGEKKKEKVTTMTDIVEDDLDEMMREEAEDVFDDEEGKESGGLCEVDLSRG